MLLESGTYFLIDNNDYVVKYLVKSWTEEETSVVRKQLSKFFATGRVPRKEDIDPAMKEHALRNRTWKDVKNYIHNYHNSQKNKLRKKKK